MEGDLGGLVGGERGLDEGETEVAVVGLGLSGGEVVLAEFDDGGFEGLVEFVEGAFGLGGVVVGLGGGEGEQGGEVQLFDGLDVVVLFLGVLDEVLLRDVDDINSF